MYKKGSRRLRGSLTVNEVKLLKSALKDARLESCSCSQNAKDELRTYLQSYVAGPIDRVLKGLESRMKK